MSFGYHLGEREPVTERKDFFLSKYLDDVDIYLIQALAIAETNSLEVMLDKKEVYTIAEEYATGGLKILKDMVLSGTYGSFSKKLEVDLIDKFETLK